MHTRLQRRALAAAALSLVAQGCTPAVTLDASVKPIAISLFVKIDQDVRVSMDDDLKALLSEEGFTLRGNAETTENKRTQGVRRRTVADEAAPPEKTP